jgi:hypothetical protein
MALNAYKKYENAYKAYKRTKDEIRAGMVDMESGELLEGMLMVDRRSPKHYWGATFVVLFQEAMTFVAKERLSGESLTVFVYVLGTLGFENEWLVLNQREVGEVLGMRRQHVNRALRDLASREILTKGCRLGKGHAYSLNPNLGWKGDFRKHEPAKDGAPKLRLIHSAEKEELVAA